MKANSSPDIKVFLIGNKSDLEKERVISSEQAKKFCEQYEIDFFMESSAKTGMNVQEIFIEAAKVLYKDYLLYKENKKKKKGKDDIKKLSDKPKQTNANKKGCCWIIL